MQLSDQTATARLFLRPVTAEAAHDHALLIEAIATASGVERSEVRLAVRCSRCGRDDHGKPQIAAPRGWHASISRTDGLVAVVVTDAAPIGIDVESLSRVGHAPLDAALLHPAERAALPPTAREEHRAMLWTAKEAVLKATGQGLTVEPALLELRADGDRVTLHSWPDELAIDCAPLIATFELDGNVRGAIALLAAEGTRLKVELA